ncbi:MAG: hypothetical protein P8J69_01710 [Flavobacteriaceae bacterium]|nr:hypothetical protein [Flavobacteriaceae bacterium]
MKKLIYLFLVLLIVACSIDSSDDNLSIVGKWQVTSASFETDECFYENEFEFFNDLQGPL